MLDFRFTTLIGQEVSLYYFRTNTTLYRIDTEQKLYQDSFIKVEQCFCKLGQRKEEYYVFFYFQSRTFLTACYILYPGHYLENKGNQQT